MALITIPVPVLDFSKDETVKVLVTSYFFLSFAFYIKDSPLST